MKKLVHIHGGEAFNSYEEYLDFLNTEKIGNPWKESLKKWKDSYEEELGENWQILRMRMPCGFNSRYEEWRIWFEKHIPYFEDGIVLVGHSLGANFLTKFLSENIDQIDVSQLHLVSGFFGWDGGFELPNDLKKVEDQCRKIYIYHSQDDPAVPFEHANKFKEALPSAELITFEDKGHLLVPEFPELMERIKK